MNIYKKEIMVTDSSTQPPTYWLEKKAILSIDPGKQTGIALGIYGDGAYQLLKVWQVADGLKGFIKWWNKHGNKVIWFREWADRKPIKLVCEKFVLRSNQFVADTEPLLIEGALTALHDGEIVWQLRSDKSLVDDTVLKQHNLWHTGKQVDWKDARDTNDAIIHALAYLKKNKHIPTLQKYWGREGSD